MNDELLLLPATTYDLEAMDAAKLTTIAGDQEGTQLGDSESLKMAEDDLQATT